MLFESLLENVVRKPREYRRFWLDSWRAYVNQAPKKVVAATAVFSPAAGAGLGGGHFVPPPAPRRPGSLTQAVRDLMCPCHPWGSSAAMLGLHPPQVSQKRGR